MRIDILTLFPEMFTPLEGSIIKRAREAGAITVQVHDIRFYSQDKHKKCDDYPFGGGAGMLMTPQPIASAISAIDPDHKAWRVYLSPKGKVLSQTAVKEYAKKERLLLLCGHYEGVDQRVIDLFIDEELSVGDYVLTGGELPAMVVTDAVARYVEGVLNAASLKDESHTGRRLEYPQYTRPQEFMGLSVPEVLVSGDHKKVEQWRQEESLLITRRLRPDLLTEEERQESYTTLPKPKVKRRKRGAALKKEGALITENTQITASDTQADQITDEGGI